MKDWKKTIIHASRPILEALKIIDDSALQIALVTDDNGRLVGVVTDGDIRRAMLHGVALTEAVNGIMFRNFTVVNPSTSREEILSIMKARDLKQIPVVDDSGKVVGIKIVLDLIRQPEKENWVVLMAGGLGKRLQPLTNDCPKPLLMVGNKPILQTVIESFLAQGFKKFYISINYKGEMIESFLGDGVKWGADIRYLREVEKMGTAGSLGLLPARPEEAFIVMNADVLTKINFQSLLDFHTSNAAAATMGVREYNFELPYGVITAEHHRLIEIREKPTQSFMVNAGIYVLEPNILDLVSPDTFLDMTELFKKIIEHRYETAVFPIHEYWIDIGLMNDLQKVKEDYQENLK